jgi:hypothetical protein
VWAFGVVVDTPFLDDDVCLPETVEDFTIEAFIPELCSVAFQAIAIVLPCPCNTSIWLSFVTICSAESHFLPIFSLLPSSILSYSLVQKKPVKALSFDDQNRTIKHRD